MDATIPAVLTIAGSDSGGGAGIQADLLTFAANGVFGTTAITALTAQNPAGVTGIFPVSADFVREQIEQIAIFFSLRAAKTGMLFNAEIIAGTADFFDAHREIPLVLDPVMVATSGARLLEDDAISILRTRLIPRAALITPNLNEAEILLGEIFSWRRHAQSPVGEIEKSARALAKKLGVPVLLKGGHGNGETLFDVCAQPDGEIKIWQRKRIAGTNTHGSGCTLSAAITAQIARGESLFSAIERAGAYLHRAIANPVALAGTRFIAH